MTTLLALLFVLSGAASLIYESIWSRYLGLLVGHSAYAQVIVLVIFLGGMSAGAALAARGSSRLREPLLWYAAVEGIVGLLGFAFHELYVAASDFAYDTLFPGLAGGATLLVVKWTLAGLLILPQSVLLGTTFPLMTAGVLRRLGNTAAQAKGSGKVLGLLYFANSLGAAVGVLIAGFWLIDRAGLPGTILVAAILNLIVAIATFGLLRFARTEDSLTMRVHADGAPGAPNAPAPADVAADADATDVKLRERLWRLLLCVSFGTAVASFIYEIAWVRMLSLVLGSATHAFELMLSAFILGLALGSLYVRQLADDSPDAVRLLGIVQCAMGTLAVATLAVYPDVFSWMAILLDTAQRNANGYVLFNIARFGLALSVMLPATFCAGMTLPLITRTLLAAGAGERAIGAVYAWNTLGSIFGVAIASLVLMPILGLRGLLILGGAIDLVIGIWLLFWRAQDAPALRHTAVLATAAGSAVMLSAVYSPAFDPGILTSGVFRYGSVPEAGSRTIVYYKDGRTATVSVLSLNDGLSIATNGKVDASVSKYWFGKRASTDALPALNGDEATQVLLPLVTLAHAPNARRAAVIGHGSGMSSHFLLGSPKFESVTTIDIEPQMIEASRLFLPANRRVFHDPRSFFVVDDARSYFASAGQQFDLILSEPSDPWVSGVSGLFTHEFYARVTRYLTPGGVFGQWINLYEMEDDLVLTVLAALHQNFHSYQLFLTQNMNMLIVASNKDRTPTPDWSVFQIEDIARDLSRFRPITPGLLEGTRLITDRELAPIFSGSGANSDFFPKLDLGAERARFLKHEALGFATLPVERFDLAAAIGERRIPLLGNTQPALAHNRFLAQGIAAGLRYSDTTLDSSAATRSLQAAHLRAQRLRLEWGSGRPPADWQAWFAESLVVERDYHQGSMGVVDGAWYHAMERYMTEQHAPEGALAALRFLRAAATYEWAGAAREVPRLVDARDRGIAWLPLELFRDAAVLAQLRTGDLKNARATLLQFRTTNGRMQTDLRTALLDAHVTAAERALAKDRLAAEKFAKP